MLNIVLTSESSIKRKVLEDALKKSLCEEFKITCINTDIVKKPPQPLNDGTLTCSLKRILHVQKHLNPTDKNIIISIENGVYVNEDSSTSDICLVVLVGSNNFSISHKSQPIKFPVKYYNEAIISTPQDYELKHLGIPITIGEMIQKEFNDVDPKNWMSDNRFGSYDRYFQIMEPLMRCISDYKKNVLKSNILYFDNFPKQGVRFKDLSNILKDPILLHYLADCLVETVTNELKDVRIDKIIGLDSRGFIVGPILAYRLNAGFVMARKHGKLPASAATVEYGTEYSKDSIGIMPNVINNTDNVLIIDDLVATGGSLDAAKKLVNQVGGNVVGTCCILQVDSLVHLAKEKLNGTPLIVILQ